MLDEIRTVETGSLKLLCFIMWERFYRT